MADSAERLPGPERTAQGTPLKDWGILRDIPFLVTVEVGSTKLRVRDILALDVGSLVVTTRLSGEPLDISLHGEVLGRAEVVIIKDKLGARLTKIQGGEP